MLFYRYKWPIICYLVLIICYPLINFLFVIFSLSISYLLFSSLGSFFAAFYLSIFPLSFLSYLSILFPTRFSMFSICFLVVFYLFDLCSPCVFYVCFSIIFVLYLFFFFFFPSLCNMSVCLSNWSEIKELWKIVCINFYVMGIW